MPKPTATVPLDLYQEATNKIIKALEAGTTPWQKPWSNVNAGPLRNGTTNHIYHGVNSLLLSCASLERGFTDPRWLSYKQSQDNGWKVKKGAKAERVYFYKPFVVDERDVATGLPVIDTATGRPKQKQIPLIKSALVFNAQEIEGMPALVAGDNSFTPIEAGEEILCRSPVEIRHGGNAAYYNHAADFIAIPNKEQFESPESYYSTLAHEMLHSTGHESRCNREFGRRFGDNAYAFEEMVAEIGTVQICLETGLPHSIEASSTYIQNWLDVLKSDKKAIFTASAKSGQAVDFVMGRQSLEVEADPVRPAIKTAQMPSLRRSPVEMAARRNAAAEMDTVSKPPPVPPPQRRRAFGM